MEKLHTVKQALTSLDESMDQLADTFQGYDDIIRESFLGFQRQVDYALHLQLDELTSCKNSQQKPNSIEEMESIRRRDVCKHTLNMWNQNKEKGTRIPHIQNSLFLLKLKSFFQSSFMSATTIQMSIIYQPISFLQLPVDSKEILNHVKNGLMRITRDPTTIGEPVIKLEDIVNRKEQPQKYSSLWGFAVHPLTGHIFVSVEHSHCILEMNPNLEVIRSHLELGQEGGKLNQPRGIAFSPDGKRFVVIDNSNNRVLLLDENISFIKTCRLEDEHTKTFSYPQNVAFDRDGNFYVAGGASNAIFKFDYHGNYVWSYRNKTVTPNLEWTWGIGITESNEVYASCTGNVLHVISTDGVLLRHVTVPFSLSNFDHVARGPKGSLIVSCHNGVTIYFINPDGSLIHSIKVKKASGAGFAANQTFYALSYEGKLFAY